MGDNNIDKNIERFEYKCKISKNQIDYKCYKNEKEAMIDYNVIDPNISPKSYFVILRKSIDSLKNKGYKTIIQLVTEEDYMSCLNNGKWKIRNKINYTNTKCLIIECPIDDALIAISNGLGFNF